MAKINERGIFEKPGKIRRSCTDIPWLILFCSLLITWMIIAWNAFKNIEEELIEPATDSEGQLCGIDKAVEDKPYVFFFDIEMCSKKEVLTHGCFTTQVCISSCPAEKFHIGIQEFSVEDIKKQLICKSEVRVQNITLEDIQRLWKSDLCAESYFESVSIFNRCIPKHQMKFYWPFFVSLRDFPQLVEKAVSRLSRNEPFTELCRHVAEDVMACTFLIIMCAILTIVIYSSFILIMQWCASVLVWMSIILILCLMALGFGNCLLICNDKGDGKVHIEKNEIVAIVNYILNKKEFWVCLSICIGISFLGFLCFVIYLRHGISWSAQLIAEFSKIIGHVPSSLVFSAIECILKSSILGLGILVALSLLLSHKPVYLVQGLQSNCSCHVYKDESRCIPLEFYKECVEVLKKPNCSATCELSYYRREDMSNYYQIINVVTILWIISFLGDLTYAIMAFTVSAWYWSFDKKSVPLCVMGFSLYNTTRFHTGSVAFGSFIIPVSDFMQKLTCYHARKEEEGKPCIKLCCCCCIWCNKKFLKYMNRNAYIMFAVQGSNLYKSTKSAFVVFVRNISTLYVFDKVIDFVLFIPRLGIVVVMSIFTYFISVNFRSDLPVIFPHMNFCIVPVLLVILMTYFISKVMFSEINAVMDTIILCFLEDFEKNDGTPEHPYFLPKNLMKLLRKHQKLKQVVDKKEVQSMTTSKKL